jgi:hypothetical protein
MLFTWVTGFINPLTLIPRSRKIRGQALSHQGRGEGERKRRKDKLRIFREIFDDWVTRAAGIVFLLILGLVIFNVVSDLPYTHPLFGLFNFGLVPVLFIAGGIIFVFAILRS